MPRRKKAGCESIAYLRPVGSKHRVAEEESGRRNGSQEEMMQFGMMRLLLPKLPSLRLGKARLGVVPSEQGTTSTNEVQIF